MIRNRGKTSKVEQQRPGDELLASHHLVACNLQIVRTEEPEQRPSSGQHASSVSFITDWADS
jgi:hypothetical protein